MLKEGQIFGNLTARDGVIDNLEVVFPDDEEIVVHGSEMNGNVFNYYHNSEMYSGLIYQSENQGYMITLVNGPYQGTKMKFESEERREVARALSNDENLDQRLGNPVGDNYYPREEEYAHEVEGLEKNEFKPKELDEEYDAEKQEYREDYRDEYKDDRVKDYEARYDDAEYSS
ncbi:MAG: hypothetical protein H6621_07110 [Halobacteriovoraceae bacterium]|nr:hypothetical protein [Halobacteriovoraceae bacterium]